MTTDTVHAGDSRGTTNCGNTTPGRSLANVVREPETWRYVTCILCLETRWTSAEPSRPLTFITQEEVAR